MLSKRDEANSCRNSLNVVAVLRCKLMGHRFDGAAPYLQANRQPVQGTNWLSGLLERLIEALCLLQSPIKESFCEAPSLLPSAIGFEPRGEKAYQLLCNCSTNTERFRNFEATEFSGMYLL